MGSPVPLLSQDLESPLSLKLFFLSRYIRLQKAYFLLECCFFRDLSVNSWEVRERGECVCARMHVCTHVSSHECMQYVHDASIKVKGVSEIMSFYRHFQPKFSSVEFLYLLLFYIFSLSIIGKILAPNYINIFIICFMLIYVTKLCQY